jgi:MFS family permease
MAPTVGGRVPLFALIGANAVSLLGNTVAAVAIPWFVLVTTGSPARTGIAAFFTTLPLAVGAFFGGAVADAIGSRRASVAGDLVGALAVAAIPLLHALDALEFWHVVALAFLGALFDAPAQAAREALLPELARRAGMPLERATGLWTTTEHMGYVLGAPAAGILIATLGAPNALWIDAASFAASALLVVAFVRVAPVARERRRYVEEVMEGLRFVWSDATLRTFLALATVGNFLIAPLGPVILPILAREEFGGADDLGFLVGAYGAGGLAGALSFVAVGRRVPRRVVYLASWLAYPVAWFALAPLPPLGVAVAALFVIGLSAGALSPVEQLVRQERTPPELRARTFSTFMATLTVVVPPATLAAGLLADVAGVQVVVLACAAANALLALWAATSRAGRAV